MRILKKILGGKNKPEIEEVENQIEKIKKGEITEIYPILKPGDWIGLKYGAIRKVLVGTEENPSLVIGYGYDTPTDFIFLNESDLAKESIESIRKKAYDNIENFEVDYNEVIPGKVLIVDGLDFCSEKILSPTFRKKLHVRLKSEKVLISIPRRRNLMATSAIEDENIMNKFMSIHNNTWQDDSYGNAPITNMLFLVENGEITQIINTEN